MILRYHKNANPGDSGNGKKSEEPEAKGDSDTCRCKEASEMTPRELFKLMISDLSFWKRVKKE